MSMINDKLGKFTDGRLGDILIETLAIQERFLSTRLIIRMRTALMKTLRSVYSADETAATHACFETEYLNKVQPLVDHFLENQTSSDGFDELMCAVSADMQIFVAGNPEKIFPVTAYLLEFIDGHIDDMPEEECEPEPELEEEGFSLDSMPVEEAYKNGRLGIEFLHWLNLNDNYRSDTFEMFLQCELVKALAYGAYYNFTMPTAKDMVFNRGMLKDPTVADMIKLGIDNESDNEIFDKWFELASQTANELFPEYGCSSELLPETINMFLKHMIY